MERKFHVVYVTDARYRPYVKVSADSVKRSASNEVVVHVIDVDAPEVAQRLKPYPEYHGSRAPYAKILIPELLPDVDWALYLDGDTLALGDVCEVFENCDASKLIVGSRDPEEFNLGPDVEGAWLREHGLSFGKIVLCTGVMLMNLRAMREEGVDRKCQAFLKAYGAPPLADQTVLNYVCRDQIDELPPQWGVFSMCPQGVDFSKSCIIHYPQDLPWKREKPNKLINDFVWLWWKFARENSRVEVKRCSVWWLKRLTYLIIKHCPWLVTWSPYLKARLRPITGLPACALTRLCDTIPTISLHLINTK